MTTNVIPFPTKQIEVPVVRSLGIDFDTTVDGTSVMRMVWDDENGARVADFIIPLERAPGLVEMLCEALRPAWQREVVS